MQLNVLNDLAEAMNALDGKKKSPHLARVPWSQYLTPSRSLVGTCLGIVVGCGL